MQVINLEERTERHKQLVGRRFPTVPVAAVAEQLRHATFLGAGAFCRVWRVNSWGVPSPARNQPVVRSTAWGSDMRRHLAVLPTWVLAVASRCAPPSALQAVKVCSAGFKQLSDEERRNKQYSLQRHWWVQS